MMDSVYQEEHLKFVSNNNGSSIVEIIIAGLPVHLSSLVVATSSLLFNHSSPIFRLFELCLVVISPLLSLTILSEYGTHIISVLSLLVILTVSVIVIKRKGSTKDLQRLWDLKISEDGILDFITNYRSSMLLITAICILAVDFPIFPRKFAKTENFGCSVMDLGVGGFVFAAGLTSREGRGKSSSVKKTVINSLPLFLLGFLRLVLVSVLGYHNNVTEYGVHWNFFFTLFFVQVFGSAVIPRVSDSGLLWKISLLFAVIYEGFLSFGVVDYIMSDAPRHGFIDANREGVASLQGFLAIYLAGAAWAHQIFHTPFTFTVMGNVLQELIVWAVLMWFSLSYSRTFFMPPSRRLGNYNFFSLTLAYNLSILAAFVLIEVIVIVLAELKTGDCGRFTKDKKNVRPKKKKELTTETVAKYLPWKEKGERTNILYRAISYNPLTFFLLANVMTGIVNVLFPTVEMEGCPAVIILISYLATISIFVIVLYHNGKKIA